MRLIRRQLRRGVVAWLACHVLTFTALVPRDCCAAHAHGRAADEPPVESAAPAEAGAPCHETAASPAPEAHCDMATADGAACPMHRPGAAPVGCRMSGVCHAPEAALAAVIWQAAIPPSAAEATAPVAARLAAAPVVERSITRAIPPDLPPPRS